MWWQVRLSIPRNGRAFQSTSLFDPAHATHITRTNSEPIDALPSNCHTELMPQAYKPYRSDFLQAMDQVKDLLIIVAMESEEQALLSEIQTQEIAYGKTLKLTAKQFNLPRCRVTVARSGVGLVKAGLLLATIVEHQKIDAVLLLGVGGALDKSLAIGDTVIAKQVIQHDSISSTQHRNILIAPGELTISASADQQTDPVMRCDSTLRAWISSAMKNSGAGRVAEGTILSGSEFAASPDRKAALRALADDALLVDMEAAALAQVSRMLSIPFAAAKTVADRAEPESSVFDDYKKFLSAATAHSHGVMKSLLATFS